MFSLLSNGDYNQEKKNYKLVFDQFYVTNINTRYWTQCTLNTIQYSVLCVSIPKWHNGTCLIFKKFKSMVPNLLKIYHSHSSLAKLSTTNVHCFPPRFPGRCVGVGGSGYYCYGSQLGNSTQPAAMAWCSAVISSHQHYLNDLPFSIYLQISTLRCSKEG